MQRSPSDSRRLPKTREVLVRVLPLAVLLFAAALVGYRLGWFDYRHALEHVERIRRAHSFVGFAIGFTVAVGLGTAIGIPGLPLMVAAGVAFGGLVGAVVSWVGALISATVGYWLARTIGRDVITRWVKRFKRVDTAMRDAKHFLGILRLRLIPVIPIGAVNFVGGLSRANFFSYLAATAIGVLPAVTIYNYFADSLVEGVANSRADALRSLILSSILMLTLSLAPTIYSRFKNGRGADVAPSQ